MSNLGQLFGQDKLRIMQLEDELAGGRRSPSVRAVSDKPAKVRPGVRPGSTAYLILKALETASARMSQNDIEAALPGVKPMTIYMALRDLRNAAPARVSVKGSGFKGSPYQYAIAGRFE